MRALILLILFIPVNVKAVTYIEQGTPAPYQGFLFSKDEELKLRTNNEKLIKLEQLQYKYDALNEVQSQRIEELRKGLETETKKSSYNQYYLYGGMLIGMLTMYYAVKAAGDIK
jgi:hypothetical protein